MKIFEASVRTPPAALMPRANSGRTMEHPRLLNEWAVKRNRAYNFCMVPDVLLRHHISIDNTELR